MKRRFALAMAALLTVSSVPQGAVVSVAAQEMTADDGWTSETEGADVAVANVESADAAAVADESGADGGEEALDGFGAGDVSGEDFSDGFVSEEDGFGSSQALLEQETEQSIFPAEEEITRLELDQDYEAQVQDGEAVWYSFEPEESGTYVFGSQGDADTFGALYNADEIELAVNDDGESEEVGKNFEISCDLEAGERYYLETSLTDEQSGAYTVSVAQVFEEKTDELVQPQETPEEEGQIESAELVLKSKYYTKLDQITPREIELKITYKDGEVRYRFADQKDAYGNYFRIKMVLDSHDAIYGGSGIVAGDFLTGSGISMKTAGTYKLQVYLRDTDQLLGESQIVVEAVPTEGLTVVEAGKAFQVAGGEEFLLFTPQTDGYYYLEEAPEHTVEEVIVNDAARQLYYVQLKAGTQYTLRYDGEAGTAMVGMVPQLQSISLKGDRTYVEHYTTGYQLQYVNLIGHYSNGKEYEISERTDYWGNYVDQEVLDSGGNRVWMYAGAIPAGDYTIRVLCEESEDGSDKYVSVPFHVYSFKELAKTKLETGKRQTIKNVDGTYYGIFSYTPETDGIYRFEAFCGVYIMKGYDEAGNSVEMSHSYNYADDEWNTQDMSRFYFATLSKGHTYYFAVDNTYTRVPLKVENVSKTVKTAVLSCENTYYAGFENVSLSDFYLDVTYEDGTSKRIKGGRRSVDGEVLSLSIEQTNSTSILTGGSIKLKSGDYVVKAYLNGRTEAVAQTTIQVKNIDVSHLPEVQEGKAFHVNGGDSSQFFVFKPAQDGSYYAAGGTGTYDVEFYMYYRSTGKFQQVDPDCLYDENVYVIRYTGSQAADITLGRHTEENTEDFELELDKKYENVVIGIGYSSVTFTYTPKETGIYEFDLVPENKSDKNGYGVVSGSDGTSRTYYQHPDNMELLLKKDVSYSFRFYGGNERVSNCHFTVLLKQLKDRSTMPVDAYFSGKTASSAVGIMGVDTLESLKKNIGLYFNYDETSFGGRGEREYFKLGENTDFYGNTYMVSQEEITTDASVKKEYKLKVTCGNVSDEIVLTLLNPEKVETITKDKSIKVNYGENGVYTEGTLCYRLEAKEHACYQLSLDSTTNITSLRASAYKADGTELDYDGDLDGFWVKPGETYYFFLSYYSNGTGTASVSIGPAKEIADFEMIREPDEVYGIYGLISPVYDGAVFRVTYTDGSQQDVEYNGVNGTGYYDRINAKTSWAADRKTFTVQYSIGSSFYTERKTYNAVSREDIKALEESEDQKVDFESGSYRKIFKVNVSENSKYKITVKSDNHCTYYVMDEQGNTLDLDGDTYTLEKGQQYYVVLFGSGTGTVRLVNTLGCDHTYIWVVDKAATCGSAGSKHEECSKCHAKKASVVIPATGAHRYQVVTDKAATCGTAGSQHEECTVCHTKKASTVIPATGKHTFGEYTVTKAATIDAAGVKERKCTVCGTTETATVAKVPATISVASKKVTVAVGKSMAAPAVKFANGDKIVSWKSAKPAIATVSKTGKITGKKAGKTTITVTLKSKKTAKITVTVAKTIPTKSLKADKKTLTLKKGKSYQLKVTVNPVNTTDKLTFKSSNTKIVTVSSKGKLKAKKKGKATITITSGKKKVTCKVTVK